MLFENKNIIKKISSIYGNQSIIGGINIKKKNEKYYLLEDKKLSIDPVNYAKELE